MHKTYFIKEGNRKRLAEPYKCRLCKKTFLRRKNEKRKRKYCSKVCSYSASENKIELRCHNCKKKFLRPKSCLKLSKSKLYFCSRKCKELSQSLIGDGHKIRPAHYGNGNSYHNSISDKKIEKGCMGCGQNKKYLLNIHHIDGNRKNNIEKNLEAVCPTCHTKRHLKRLGNSWRYDSKHLTPRNMLNKV